MAAVMSAVDKNGDDEASLEELIVAITTSAELQQLGDIFVWRQHFERFDIDRSGFVDSDEVLGLVQATASAPLTEPVVRHLKEQTGDGQIEWQGFLDMMTALTLEFKSEGLWLQPGDGNTRAGARSQAAAAASARRT
eukprot:SAG22_NODE_2398_length_2618_cov_1.421199_1_plen_137_part_00